MRLFRTGIPFAFILILLALYSASEVRSRTVLDRSISKTTIIFEMVNPDDPIPGVYPPYFSWNAVDDPTFFSAAYFLGVRTQANDQLAYFAELPMSFRGGTEAVLFYNWDPWNGGYEYYYGAPVNEKEALGNILVGGEYDFPRSPAYLQLDVRLPTAKKRKSAALRQGWTADFDRAEAFWADFLTVSALFGLRNQFKSGLSLEAYWRVNYLSYVGEGELEKTPFIIDVGGSVGHGGRWARVKGGVSARFFNDAPVLNREEIVQFNFDTDFLAGRFRPGVHFHTALNDDYFNLTHVRFSFGLNFSVLLGRVYD